MRNISKETIFREKVFGLFTMNAFYRKNTEFIFLIINELSIILSTLLFLVFGLNIY